MFLFRTQKDQRRKKRFWVILKRDLKTSLYQNIKSKVKYLKKKQVILKVAAKLEGKRERNSGRDQNGEFQNIVAWDLVSQ